MAIGSAEDADPGSAGQRSNGDQAVRRGMQTVRAGLPRWRPTARADGCVVTAVAGLEADTVGRAAWPKRARRVRRLACTAGEGWVAQYGPGRFDDDAQLAVAPEPAPRRLIVSFRAVARAR
jgi:hypothetical protein